MSNKRTMDVYPEGESSGKSAKTGVDFVFFNFFQCRSYIPKGRFYPRRSLVGFSEKVVGELIEHWLCGGEFRKLSMQYRTIDESADSTWGKEDLESSEKGSSLLKQVALDVPSVRVGGPAYFTFHVLDLLETRALEKNDLLSPKEKQEILKFRKTARFFFDDDEWAALHPTTCEFMWLLYELVSTLELVPPPLQYEQGSREMELAVYIYTEMAMDQASKKCFVPRKDWPTSL